MLSLQAVEAREQNDRTAAPPAHLANRCADYEERSADVDLQDVVEHRGVRSIDRAVVAEYAGTRDGDANVPELIARSAERTDDIVLGSDISGDSEGATAGGLDSHDGCVRARRIAIQDGDVSTEVGERQRSLEPNARCATSDEGNVPC
jgi:hypothetical protein